MRSLRFEVGSRFWAVFAWATFLSYLILIVWTFRDYGITWDEEWQAKYGDFILRWYASGFKDHAALEYGNLNLYGGFFEVLSQLGARVAPWDLYESRHLFTALFGFLGMLGAYALGKHLGGPPAGFLSALFLLLIPRFYGDAFNNSKDVPFAVLFLISLVCLLKAIAFFPRIPRRFIVQLGLAFGFTLGIRVAGILLFGYLVLAFSLWAVAQYVFGRVSSPDRLPFWRASWVFARGLLGIGAIAYLVMLVWWPAAQAQPVYHPVRALWKFAHFEAFSRPVLFEGRMVLARQIPWYYIPKWILITLPEFCLLGLVAGLLATGIAVARRNRAHHFNRWLEYSVLVLSVLLPLVSAAISRAVVYDGLRQFLFVLPPVAVLAGVSVARLAQQSELRIVAVPVLAIIVASMLATAVDMKQLHPYEYIYFNRLFGKGVKEAARSFENEYWGSSYKEGVEWIVKNYRGKNPTRQISVASCSYPLSTSHFLPSDRFVYVGSYDYLPSISGHPDLFLATTRWNCEETFRGQILYIVQRQGVPLLYVKEIAEAEVPHRPY